MISSKWPVMEAWVPPVPLPPRACITLTLSPLLSPILYGAVGPLRFSSTAEDNFARPELFLLFARQLTPPHLALFPLLL